MPRPRQVEQGGGCGAGEDPGREPGKHPADEQQAKTLSEQEGHRAQRREGQSGQQCPPAPDLVGEPTEEQQRGDDADRVGGEDHRDG
jgi:hypothetical protein